MHVVSSKMRGQSSVTLNLSLLLLRANEVCNVTVEYLSCHAAVGCVKLNQLRSSIVLPVKEKCVVQQTCSVECHKETPTV